MLLTLLLVIVLGGCTHSGNGYAHSGNEYDGVIGSDRVTFRKSTLTVVKLSGIKIEYVAGDDLKVESVMVTKTDGTARKYQKSGSEGERQVLKKAQDQFDMYLQGIKDIQKGQNPKEVGQRIHYTLEGTLPAIERAIERRRKLEAGLGQQNQRVRVLEH